MKVLNKAYGNLFLVALLVSFTGTAWAIPTAEITYVETDIGSGLWQYDYTITNTADPFADAGFNIYDVLLTFDPGVTPTSISTPTDWGGFDGLGFAEFFSLLPGTAPLGSDIAPGQFMDSFSLQFTTRIGDASFEAIFENPTDFFNPVLANGTSTQHASIPEPATFFLAGMGLAILSFVGKKYKGLS